MVAAVKKNSRRYWLVDPKVQGILAARVVVYWLMCLLTVGLMIFCWRSMTDPIDQFYAHFREVWLYYGPAAIASLLLMPLVAWDVIRVSNRFAGPLVRLRRTMRALTRGERVKPIHFREGDFWQDFAVDFNALVERVQGAALVESDPSVSQEAISIGMEEQASSAPR